MDAVDPFRDRKASDTESALDPWSGTFLVALGNQLSSGATRAEPPNYGRALAR
jgi:hypothetical protein